MASYNTLCPGCFIEKGTVTPCPKCHYDEDERRSPLMLKHRTLLNDLYLVGRVLGKPGGFGITYLAWDTRLETLVAIKEYLPRDNAARDMDRRTVIPHSRDDEEMFRYGLDAFLKEAQTLAKFDHANVVRVRTFFEENSTAYLVMDYYAGMSLQEYLDQRGRIPEKLTKDIMMPILDGVREVHEKGFLHRDIKPHNIYLSGNGRPILLDFGAARFALGERSRSLSVVLTPGYAPYEQYHRKGEQGFWTDIYACGATLYRMITGEVPPEAVERVRRDELRAPEKMVPEISHNFSASLMWALNLMEEDRPQSVLEFQQILTSKDAEEEPEPETEAIPNPMSDSATRSDPVSKPELESEPVSVTEPASISAEPQSTKKKTKKKGIGFLLPLIGILTILAALSSWLVYNGFIGQSLISIPENLSITTNPPGAHVHADGALVGTSPLEIKGLESGFHKIKITKEKYEDYFAQISIRKGEPATIDAQLLPLPFGDLSVNSVPEDAEVYVDEIPKGKTPVILHDLPQGMKQIELRKTGYDHWSGIVEIIPLNPQVINADLISKFGSLIIESAPSNAMIYLNGDSDPIGTTPYEISRLNKGNLSFELRKECHDSEKRMVEIVPNMTKVHSIPMRMVCGSIVIESEPSEAGVYIASNQNTEPEKRGDTPLLLQDLPTGTKKIVLKKQGYANWHDEISIESQREKNLFVRLKKQLTHGDKIKNNLGMEFVYIKPGTFQMGSPSNEPQRGSDEALHRVTLTKGFHIQTTEVTQGQWKAVMGNNPSYFNNCGSDCPVENVSWDTIQKYLKKLNRKKGVEVDRYRLPTEAEWEYAARAGSGTPFSAGHCLSTYQANFDGNNPLPDCSKGEYRGKTLPVRSFSPNAWGLYNMHGNVWEWCRDWYQPYPSGAVSNPEGALSGSLRILRGGSWGSDARYCRSARRYAYSPDARNWHYGFRLVLVPSSPMR